MKARRHPLHRVIVGLVLAIGLPSLAGGCAHEPAEFHVDEVLVRQQVLERLEEDELVMARHIRVEVSKRVVWLSGKVDSEVSRQRASEVALGVRGVRGVINHLVLDDPEADPVSPLGPDIRSQ